MQYKKEDQTMKGLKMYTHHTKNCIHSCLHLNTDVPTQGCIEQHFYMYTHSPHLSGMVTSCIGDDGWTQNSSCCMVFFATVAAGLETTSATDLPGKRRARIDRISSLNGSSRRPSKRSWRAPVKFCKDCVKSSTEFLCWMRTDVD